MQYLDITGLKRIMNYIKSYINSQIKFAGGVTNIPEGGNFETYLEKAFSGPLDVTTTYAPTDWNYAPVLECCKSQGRFQTKIKLGGVFRTVLFSYDSYIFFNDYDPDTPDYYNYFSDITLNNEVFRIRMQIYLNGMMKITKYQLTTTG